MNFADPTTVVELAVDALAGGQVAPGAGQADVVEAGQPQQALALALAALAGLDFVDHSNRQLLIMALSPQRPAFPVREANPIIGKHVPPDEKVTLYLECPADQLSQGRPSPSRRRIY
jgi:hypothetical protein